MTKPLLAIASAIVAALTAIFVCETSHKKVIQKLHATHQREDYQTWHTAFDGGWKAGYDTAWKSHNLQSWLDAHTQG